MSATFVSSLRRRPEVIRLGAAEAPVIRVRVQHLEGWDAVLVAAPPSERVVEVKRRALNELVPEAMQPGDYVLKLRGIEILDEEQSLTDAGALDGSTFGLTHRRRRPVR